MLTYHYRIMANHQGCTDEVDSTDDVREAEDLRIDYQVTYGDAWVIWVEKQTLDDGCLVDVYDCSSTPTAGDR